jgi:Asp-tRNA(Asn)/Glu-tRNA(Gln) amidotransferase A subunit family amidase
VVRARVAPERLTAAAAARAIRAGRLSARELVEACLARIAARDGAVRAFVRLAPDAREAADRADAARRAGASAGPLGGVPVAVKDLIDTAGLATECGSRALAGRVPAHDAACVARLKAAGAIVLGKTATTEFAYSQPAATRNPLDPGRTPGGSSSGSAAAVADFMAPVALGTQTGGSVIRPASFCGLFGFKSSCGRTELAGVQELAGSLDTVGWFARGAEDLELLGRVLLQPPRAAAKHGRRPRIGWARTPYDGAASAAVHEALGLAASRLARHADVVRTALPASFAGLNALHRQVSSVESALAFDAHVRRAPEALSEALLAYVAEGRANAPAYAAAAAQARACRAELAGFARGFDALLVPAAPGEAPPGLASTGEATFSLFWSLLQVPCAALPLARGEQGLPVGVQLVGAVDRDEELLALVRWAAPRLAGQKNVRIAPTTS